MFIGDEVRAEAGVSAAATRLAALARGSSLTRASHAAWDAGLARTGVAGPGQGPSTLVRVYARGPAQRGAVHVLMLRWEAADGTGQPFAALDADITLLPDGDHATWIGLAGSYRTSAGTRLDRAAVHGIASVTVHTLLSRIADAISDPAASVAPVPPVRSPV